jgi:hypothetical protein
VPTLTRADSSPATYWEIETIIMIYKKFNVSKCRW